MSVLGKGVMNRGLEQRSSYLVEDPSWKPEAMKTTDSPVHTFFSQRVTFVIPLPCPTYLPWLESYMVSWGVANPLVEVNKGLLGTLPPTLRNYYTMYKSLFLCLPFQNPHGQSNFCMPKPLNWVKILIKLTLKSCLQKYKSIPNDKAQ